MQKLYIHNKPVILYSEDDNIKKEELNFLNITQPAPREIPSILKDLDKESTNGIRIKTNQSNAFLEALFSYFQHWKAAGGLITNPKGEILLLFRRGKWDLPKGKMEAGEKPEETAIREVTEETGLKNISIVKKLTDTWHSYPISVYGAQENNDQKD
ncbi:MAG TPA: NUDIX domain-containing protein, partial [Chitinophagaceae bacterium]|nr:NUDIX domain-containing protein [Chitinophagaceae bacterium]